MFVTQSRRNYATDLSEILNTRSLGPGITYSIFFILIFLTDLDQILRNCSLNPVEHIGYHEIWTSLPFTLISDPGHSVAIKVLPGQRRVL